MDEFSEKMIAQIPEAVKAYYTEHGAEPPNSALVREVVQGLRGLFPDTDVFELFPMVVGELRHTYGYAHPIGEVADQSEARPFRLNRHYRLPKEGD